MRSLSCMRPEFWHSLKFSVERWGHMHALGSSCRSDAWAEWFMSIKMASVIRLPVKEISMHNLPKY
jgi:hypothetical protein